MKHNLTFFPLCLDTIRLLSSQALPAFLTDNRASLAFLKINAKSAETLQKCYLIVFSTVSNTSLCTVRG